MRDEESAKAEKRSLYYSEQDLPLFLVAVFLKGERSNLSKSDQNDLAAPTKELVAAYRKKVVKAERRRP